MTPPPALPSCDLIKNRMCNSSQLTNIIKHFICQNIIRSGPSGPPLPCLSLGYVLKMFLALSPFEPWRSYKRVLIKKSSVVVKAAKLKLDEATFNTKSWQFQLSTFCFQFQLDSVVLDGVNFGFPIPTWFGWFGWSRIICNFPKTYALCFFLNLLFLKINYTLLYHRLIISNIYFSFVNKDWK